MDRRSVLGLGMVATAALATQAKAQSAVAPPDPSRLQDPS